MPLVDSDLQSTWDSLYSTTVNGQIVHYSRSALSQYFGNDINILIDAMISLGFAPGQRIIIIGAAFGWMGECLLNRGFGPMADGTAAGKIVCNDTSTWIHANKSGNAVIPITNINARTTQGRRTIKSQFGSPTAVVDWVLTEDILPCLTSNAAPGGKDEVSDIVDDGRALGNKVVHWVTTGTRHYQTGAWTGDPRLNWKTLEDWKAWVTPDYVVARNEGGRVL